MGIGAETTGIPDPTGELSKKKKETDDEKIAAAITAAIGSGEGSTYTSPYEAMLQQQLAGLTDPQKMAEDPTALAFLSSKVGQETSKYLRDRSESAAAQGRAGGGVAAEGRFEAYRHDALQRGAAIAGLQEKDWERTFKTRQMRMQTIGQMWAADLEKFRMDEQSEWNALNFVGQLMSMAGAEGWDEDEGFVKAFNEGRSGFMEILAGGGSVKDAGAYMLDKIGPYIS